MSHCFDAQSEPGRPMQIEPRNDALDLLKLVMSALVVLFHAQAFAEISTPLADFIDRGYGRIVVPIFLLINGYFFAKVLARGGQWRWLKWLAILYAACMLLYLPLWIGTLPGGGKAVLVIAGRWVLGYLHLWYLSGLLVAALLLVALRRWPARRLAALSLALFLLGVVLQYVAGYNLVEGPAWVQRVAHSFHVHRNALLLSFPYFCTGYLLSTQGVPQRLSGRAVGAMLVLGLAGLAAESWFNVRHAPLGSSFDNTLFGGVAACGIFLAVLRCRIHIGLRQLSPLAIGIYLLHPLAILALRRVPGLDELAVGCGAALISGVATWLLLRALPRWQRRAPYARDSIKST